MINQQTELPVIVGIGASAGGLEPLTLFLDAVPPDCGVAFIIVQHLDPAHPSLLAEILQRHTTMPVTQIVAGDRPTLNHVYVAPPFKQVTLHNGQFNLSDPVERHGLRLPVDLLFTSLAEQLKAQAIGIILSGMGADGTVGLQAIKANAGFTLVQSPESAEYSAMPLSALQAVAADCVTTPAALWQGIVQHLQGYHPSLNASSKPGNPSDPLTSANALADIIQLLKSYTGTDFGLYKKNTLIRRLERRMALHQANDLHAYFVYLQQNPQTLELLAKELLIGVTEFFRDPSIWALLKADILPSMLATLPENYTLRAWIPACSTGEEAYTLAMLLKELVTENPRLQRLKFQLFATDLNPDAIEIARLGYFPAQIQAMLSAERLANFFSVEAQGYRINSDIREMIIFAQQNIISDPPFTKLDLLFCRNLLIYFESALQKKLLPLFHYALKPQGILLLGNAENIGDFSTLFNCLDSPARIFQRNNQKPEIINLHFPTKLLAVTPMPDLSPSLATAGNDLQNQINTLLLQHYTPSAILITVQGDIVYIHGRTGQYLEPASGKANLNIHAMAREGLSAALNSAINQAQQQTDPVKLQSIAIVANNNTINVDLTVQQLSQPEALAGFLLIVFTEVAEPKTRRRKLSKPAQQSVLDELTVARESLQTLREERQTVQEELLSANEELQSTNEELQSANEELTTSKEEMQSLNEELQTLNLELQTKVTDLSWVNNDMANLLNSMEIATIF